MSAYKHYRNDSEAGATQFITTTVLDFVHAFRRDEMRDAMGYHLSGRFLVAGLWSEEAGLPLQ